MQACNLAQLWQGIAASQADAPAHMPECSGASALSVIVTLACGYTKVGVVPGPACHCAPAPALST